MALTLKDNPATGNIHGAFEPLTFALISDEQASTSPQYYKFRYIADIYIPMVDSPYTDVLQARIKVLPNSEGTGVFQIQRIVQDFMNGTTKGNIVSKNIHMLGDMQPTKLWSVNSGQNYRTVKVNFGQEYAVAEDQAATEYLDLSTNNYVNCIISAGLTNTPTYDEGGSLGDGNDYAVFLPQASTSKFLSNRPIDPSYTSTLASNVSVVQQNVTNFEWRTLATLMEDSPPVSSEAVCVYVALFDSSGAQLSAGEFTAGADGGHSPSASTSDDKKLQYIGIGPRNLAAQSVIADFATHFNAGDVSYYEVFLMDNATVVPSNATTGNMSSMCYRFDVVEAECIYYSLNGTNRYNYVTLAFQNSLGAWDYQAFALKHQRTTSSIERKTYDQIAGNWDQVKYDGSDIVNFDFQGFEGGLKINDVRARQEMTANTTLYNENDVAFIENLFLSPVVQLIDYDGSVTPIVITDKTWVRKNNLNEGGAFTYQIKFKYAKERPTVS